MTSTPRLFVTGDLAPAARVLVPAEQAHYLGQVMRRRVGDAVRLFNGRDGEWLARITVLDRRNAELRAGERLREQAPEPGSWLLFAPLKRDATDLVVQKATELGAEAILPVMTDRTNTARVNEGRLTAIAVEAAEQSERLTVPVIHAPQSLHRALETFPVTRRLFVAVERFDGPILSGGASPGGADSGLLVGPEGGFTQAELDAFDRCPIVTRVSLGPRVLRAETACLAGLALLQAPGCG
ncbi:MAG: 16S rRNA (uracil(1498)-N(3))-methyltransferase [Acetobacteraceae bacterium]